MAVQLLRTHLTVISLLHRGWLQPGIHQLSLEHLHLIDQISVLANLFFRKRPATTGIWSDVISASHHLAKLSHTL